MKECRNIETIFFQRCNENLRIKFETYLLIEQISQKLYLSKLHELSKKAFIIELALSIW